MSRRVMYVVTLGTNEPAHKQLLVEATSQASAIRTAVDFEVGAAAKVATPLEVARLMKAGAAVLSDRDEPEAAAPQDLG